MHAYKNNHYVAIIIIVTLCLISRVVYKPHIFTVPVNLLP